MNRPWMPLHIADYLTDTVHLSAAEHGAYMLLIMRYWQDGGLPTDERMIQRYSRLAPEQWSESRDVIAAFFDDGWRHKRIDEELAKADDIISKRSAAARQRHSKSNANAEHVESESTYARVPPKQLPDTSSLRSEVGRARKSAAHDLSEFKTELTPSLDEERLEAIIKLRRSKKGQLTGHAARLFAQDAKACGLSLPDAVDTCISRNWITVKPDWLAPNRPNGTGPPSNKPRRASAIAAEQLRALQGQSDERDNDKILDLRPASSG